MSAERAAEVRAIIAARLANKPEPRSRQVRVVIESIGKGPGTELKRILATIGITSRQGCSCNRMAIQMDVWGPDECRKRIDEIVEVMTREADKRGWMKRLPFKRLGARALVLRAIAASEK